MAQMVSMWPPPLNVYFYCKLNLFGFAIALNLPHTFLYIPPTLEISITLPPRQIIALNPIY